MSTIDSKSSVDSPNSRRRLGAETASAVALLTALMAGAVCWFYCHGYILYYGDAQSHLNIARGLIDSWKPGYNQIGTVWLPLLHLICVPFVTNDWLWSNGLAGSIPVAFCFVLAGSCLYLAARHVYQNSLAAAVVLACLALNPNMLYLASIPMTEQVFLAGLSVCLLALIRFRATQRLRYVAIAIVSLWAMCMTRYDGWFLIPFTALWFSGYAEKNRLRLALAVACGASLAPLYWFGHCWWLTGNALDFYNGPYSAMAIQAGRPYPGFHNWGDAFFYYGDAARLCAGWPLLAVGATGAACAIATERFSPLGYLCLTPLFYLWSIHSSGNPCYGPSWFNSYYNTRYALAVVVAAAFAAGAIVTVLGRKRRKLAYALPAFAVLPWLLHPSEENWICWKESQVNSTARRAWTAQGASHLQPLYVEGEGVLTSAGDVTGVFCKARIHLKQTLNVGNVPDWYGAGTRPDLAHDTAWAVAQSGDKLSQAVHNHPGAFELVQQIQVKGAPALEFYRRRIGNINPEQ